MATGPGFSIKNETQWPLTVSLEQVGPLYYGLINPGEVFERDTGAVWFTIKAVVSFDGQMHMNDWDCVWPIAKIVGPILLGALTGGVGAFTGVASASTSIVVNGAVIGAIKGGVVAGGATVGEKLAKAFGDHSDVQEAGCYAGPPWPFEEDKRKYRIVGGPTKTISKDLVSINSGAPLRVEAGWSLSGGAQPPATPQIKWATPRAISYGAALGPAQLNASASTAGDFTYWTDDNQNTHNKALVSSSLNGRLLPAGKHVLNVKFTPKDQVRFTTVADSVELTVQKATPAIVWDKPPALVKGEALGSQHLDASASARVGGRDVALKGTYSYFWNDKPVAAGAKLPPGLHTLKVKFKPEDTANFNEATGTVQLRVWLATHTFTKWEIDNQETFGHLALKYYKHATPYYWQWIIDANKDILPANPKYTQPGTKVFIPESPPPPGK